MIIDIIITERQTGKYSAGFKRQNNVKSNEFRRYFVQSM
ncbi:hypothetical protein Cabys_3253 [Caldithrix abyssi DSM 13497]|uniref:Uncharacterized protein n=1 Tax=Caldithrix abyssi DSM 13497 TaxID=880073 RepID=A0A1J1CCM0_CALAY|nr:hypothetical protein Cabys_3253 [Caldithrix abyssi DSM 13497]